MQQQLLNLQQPRPGPVQIRQAPEKPTEVKRRGDVKREGKA